MKLIKTRIYWLLLYCLLFGTIATAQNFVNELPIPYQIDSDEVKLRIDTVFHNFDPNGNSPYNIPIKTFAYNHPDSVGKPGALTLLGPSIRWRFGHQVHTTVQNNLSESTTTHWHGAHIATFNDGGPHQPIKSGKTWDINFEIMDKSATMWYHPHFMDKTYEHVQMGLSGMVYVEDPEDEKDDSILVELHKLLPNDYAINDFPLIVQTKNFFRPCSTEDYRIQTEGFKRFEYIINGVMNPYKEVPADMVRLRVLNGDAKFAFNFKVAQRINETDPNAVKIGNHNYKPENIQLIATDAGYMDQSYAKENVLIAPGERTEWLLDLRERTGDTLYLLNIVSEIPKGVIGGQKVRGFDPEKGLQLQDTVLLKLIVGAPKISSDIEAFPIKLKPLDVIPYFDYTRKRVKTFSRETTDTLRFEELRFEQIFTYNMDSTVVDTMCEAYMQHAKGLPYLINDTPMDMMVVNDTVALDSTEIWVLDNHSDIAHPFHIHLLHFNVINIDVRNYEIDTIGYDAKDKPILDTINIFYTTIPHDSLPHIFKGPKDNVLVEPNWKLSFVAKFEDFGTYSCEPENSYMYHCHILPHEDRGMMGQFVVKRERKFVNEIPIPYLIDSDTVPLKIDIVEHNFNPNGTDEYNRPIEAFAYNHVDSTAGVGSGLTLLGPSIKWRFGHKVHTTVKNNLEEATTTHWHGAHIPAHTDGGPHQPIVAGSTWDINFDIMDKSATMWYHPHLMDKTYEHVQMGLSGMIYVADPPDGDDDSILVKLHELLPTEYGVNDFPIIAQTKHLTPDCIYRGGFKENNALFLINGVMNPYLKVPADMIRLRVLNGDAKFSYNFKLGHRVEHQVEGAIYDDADCDLYQLDTFHMIATDAGYMDQSYAKTEILISPGERTEWLVDLRDRAGDTLYVLNIRGNKGIEEGVIGEGLGKTVQLKIIVGEPVTTSEITQFPIPLHPLDPPAIFDYTRERVKLFETADSSRNPITDSIWVFEDLRTYLDTVKGTCEDKIVIKNSKPFLIDQTPMQLHVVNDTVWFDSTEIWTLENHTGLAHPFHIHDIHFYVTKIEDMKNGTVISPDSLPHIFKGPKDNVLVNPNWRLSFVTKFTDHATTTGVADSSYMYHCHILPHEDRGMMGQFVVMHQPDMVTTVDDPIIFNNTMKLYPNPARNQLFLDGESDETTQIRIFDLQGRVIYQQQIAPFAGTHRIAIGAFSKGMVFVEWWTSEGRFINKVIVE